MGPFDRFDDRAKRILALAQDEAIRFNHSYIGPEHLLLGLVREGEGVAARALGSLGVELTKVRTAVEFMVGHSNATASPSEITLHPRTKKIIELAIDEARKLGHSHVGTEHLLLGMVREGGSVATGILESLGLSLENVRHQVIETIGGEGTAARPTSSFGAVAPTAQLVLGHATEEAMRLGHRHLGTEHLLLGILRADGTAAARALASLGVTYAVARAEIMKAVPAEDRPPASTTLTPRMYGLVGYAKGFADGRSVPYSAETLLLALVADAEGVGAQVLAAFGAAPEKVREALATF